jgi:hypothetical protein
MKTLIALLLAFFALAPTSLAQVSLPGPIESGGGPLPGGTGGPTSTTPCTNTGAKTLVPGGSSTTPPTVQCTSGELCGFVRTYNPPATTCVQQTGRCCVSQLQQAYTQFYVCGSNGKCQAGARTFHGPSVLVKVTVGCGTTNSCGQPAAF